MAVLFVDLDGFKTVNDTLGHASGDELLIQVAGRLTAVLGGQDTVARIAGDEFVAVCEGVGEAAAAELADRLREAIAAPVPLGDHVINAKASVGIAVATGSFDPDAILQRADEAMYAAKRCAPAGCTPLRCGVHVLGSAVVNCDNDPNPFRV